MDNTDQYPMYMCSIGISDIQHIRYLSDTSDGSKSCITFYIRSLHCENFFLVIGKWNEYTDLDLEKYEPFSLA